MIPHDLPDYVERGGRQVWRPPYTARAAELYGFVLGAERAAIDELLQRDLVEPSGGAVDYRCAHESVLVTFAAIGRLASGDPPDSLRGHVPELEVSVWCLAADVLAAGRLVWYLPYVLTDPGQAVATGREVYGYPKQMAFFESGYPDRLAQGGVTAVQALAIDPFDPAQAAVRRTVVSAKRQGQTATGGTGVVGSGAAAFAGLTGLIGAGLAVDATLPHGPHVQASAVITPPGHAPPPPAPPPWALGRVIDRIMGRDLTADPSELVAEMVESPTLVFLKQFRDVTCPTKACYQAIVEAPLVPHPAGATYEELDPGLFELTLEDWASHPLASDVGVPAGQPRQPQLAFHAKLDFDIELGHEVWRAPT